MLGGRDLHRDIRGTWLGVTKDGRIAVLTNFRDDTQPTQGVRSRGAMVNAFLTQSPETAPSTEDFVRHLIHGEGVQGVGGFSLVCGRAGEALAVVSNRTPSADGVAWVATKPGQIVGLSNAAFGDQSWPKVVNGEKLMGAAITKALDGKFTEDQLIQEMMELLSTDTLPRFKGNEMKESWKSYLKYLRNSIFIPAIAGDVTENAKADEVATAETEQPVVVNGPMSGMYGTQIQTVVLVDHEGECTFVQKNLFEALEKQIRKFKFQMPRKENQQKT